MEDGGEGVKEKESKHAEDPEAFVVSKQQQQLQRRHSWDGFPLPQDCKTGPLSSSSRQQNALYSSWNTITSICPEQAHCLIHHDPKILRQT